MAAPTDVGVSHSPASYDRVPPHNLDAEVSVLGSMLLSRDAIAEVSEFVGPEDFYRGAHRTIYESVRNLYDRGEPVDPVTVADELDRRGTLSDIGGALAIADLVARVPTAANALYYARIVAEHAVRRRLIDAGTQITRLGYEAEEADEAVDSAEGLVYQVAQRNRGREFASMKELLTASFELIERLHDNNSAITGLATGFVDFDECTAGLQPANLVILAARPAMGKCVSGSTAVLDPTTGALRRIDEIIEAGDSTPFHVASLSSDLALRPRRPTELFDNGVQPVVRLRTRLGREMVVTRTHPFLTIDGWVPLAILAPGARIAAPRALPFFGAQERPDAEVAFVAQTMREDSSPEAAVPEAFFQLPRRQVALFLDRLFACDVLAAARADDRRAPVECTTGSATLAAQVQHLLLRFGISAAVSSTRDREGTERFTVEVLGRVAGTSGLCWDEIVSIESAGEERVYDLEVPGDHNFVAGDLIVHNSTLVTNIATHVAVNLRRPAVLFSLEMSQMELVLRILAGEAKVDSERLRTGRLQEADWPKLSQAMGRLAEAPLFIDDTAGINLLEIRSKCRRLKQQHGLDLVVLDYLQLMQPSRRIDNRVQEVAEISRGLKILAKELDVPVIALSQLSRKPEDRSDRRPQLADLRDSGCLTAGTLVTRADTGAMVPIGELLRGRARDIPVRSLDDHGQFVRATMTHVFPTGVRPVYRVALAGGRTVEATANHPLRTPDGWRPLIELAAGSRVAVDGAVPGAGTGAPQWDEIVRVTPLGEQPVYDATVLGTHSFLANGIVVHNSIEQDADIVCFIYRDEVYDKESAAKGEAELIIAKHRNGPLRTIHLSFLGHHSRFANMARGPGPGPGSGNGRPPASRPGGAL